MDDRVANVGTAGHGALQNLLRTRCSVEAITLREAGLEERKAAIHRSLHRLWTRNVGTKNYAKDDWMDLERDIQRFVKLVKLIVEDARETEMRQ